MPEEIENQNPNEEIQVNENLEKMLADAAKRKDVEKTLLDVQEAMKYLVKREDFDTIIKGMQAENSEMRDILLRAKAQGRAEIIEKKTGSDEKLKETYKGTVLEGML